MTSPSEPVVLVVDSEQERGGEIAAGLRAASARAEVALDAEQAWERFAGLEPGIVIAAPDGAGAGAGTGGDAFLDRLRREYIGPTPTSYLLLPSPGRLESDATRWAALDVDGLLVPPVSRATLAALLAATQPHVPPTLVDSRMCDLVQLTLLGGGAPLDALGQVLARAAAAFGVADLIAWEGSGDPLWPRFTSSSPPPELVDRIEQGQRALAVGTTLLADHRSFAAASLGPADAPAGGLALVSERPRVFSSHERQLLDHLARRLGQELAWVAAHARLSQQAEELRNSAMRDGLLGVLNRIAFEQATRTEVKAARRRHEPLALAVLDVVGMRGINDRHGHQVGDQVLIQVAATLKAQLRANDLIGRIDGDELGVLLVGAPLDSARSVLERVLRALEADPVRLPDGDTVPLSVRLGVTRVAPDESSGEHAFRRARRAMRMAPPMSVGTGEPAQPGDADEPSGVYDLEALGGIPPGSTLGGMYRILHEISRGAMGVVYRAEDLGLGRPVAIKVLRSDLASRPDLVARFRAEASLLASVHHPNLVQVHSLGREAGEVFFVMELVEGEPLSQLMKQAAAGGGGEPLSRDLLARTIVEAADALTALHSAGMLHRDVKPANILLDRARDRAVLVDVGVAGRRDDKRDTAGTPGYSAPECFMDRPETPASDVYGLAATAYVLLTGVMPFGRGDIDTVVKRQLSVQPEPASRLCRGLPVEVDEVLVTALAPDPRDRYQSAAAFAGALAVALRPRGAPIQVAADRAVERFRRALEARDKPLVSWSPPARPVGTPPSPPSPPSPPLPGALSAVTVAPAGLASTAPTVPPVNSVLSHLPGAPGPARCRGILFRVVSKALVQKLGPGWVHRAAARQPRLSDLLEPTLSPVSWHRLEDLVALLRLAAPSLGRPRDLARSLGRGSMAAAITAMLGADPRSLSPATVLAAAPVFLPRLIDAGPIAGRAAGERGSDGQFSEYHIELSRGLPDPLVCALVAGALGRAAEMAGAERVAVAHPECHCQGGPTCRFQVTWSPDGPA